eukprot:1088602-Pyramimonas_sp.AAC.1
MVEPLGRIGHCHNPLRRKLHARDVLLRKEPRLAKDADKVVLYKGRARVVLDEELNRPDRQGHLWTQLYSHNGPIRRKKRRRKKHGYILTMDQSDARSEGIFSQWTNQTQEAQ